ncbi:MAG: glycosyltransferase family 9 protein [Bilophila sp.]
MPRHLVIQLARFGDIIQTGRLVRSLVATGDETHLCVDRSLVELARRIYPACVIHSVVAHAGSGLEALTQNRTCFAELAQLSFASVYNLNYSGMNRAMATLFDPAIVRGYSVDNGQPLRERWMRMAFRWTLHRQFAPVNLGDFGGRLAPDPLPPDKVNPVATPGGRGLGVVLAGRQARRSLPPEVLATVIQARFEALGGPPVTLFGSASERPVGRQLMRHLSRQVVGKTDNLAGRTDWGSLMEALTGLDALLTPDTGTMHLAARLGVPVLGVFLSSAWAWETGPYGLGHRVWQAVPPCAPCAEIAPCVADMDCLAPFRSPAFLLALAERNNGQKKANTCVPGLLAQDTAFDELGLIWKTASADAAHDLPSDPAAARRTALRTLLMEYQGVAPAATCAQSPPLLADGTLAENLYPEADWMLPGSFRSTCSCRRRDA